MSNKTHIIDVVKDNNYSRKEVKQAVDSIKIDTESFPLIYETTIEDASQSFHQVKNNRIIVTVGDIVRKKPESMFASTHEETKSQKQVSTYKPCVRCSLCFRFVHSGQLVDGHRTKSKYSETPLSKVLVTTIQTPLKLPKTNWLLCRSCVEGLQEADEKLKEFSEIQQSMSELKRKYIHIVKNSKVSYQQQAGVNTPGIDVVGPHDIRSYSYQSKQEQAKKSVLKSSISHEERKEKIPCPLCGKVVSKKALRTHIPHLHIKKIPIICKICVLKLPDEVEFADHLLSCHPEVTKLDQVMYSCEIEKAITPRSKKKVKLACPYCGVSFTRRYLKIHINNVHDENYVVKCKLCPQTFSKSFHRILHMRRVHGYARPIQEPIACQYCKKVYNGKILLGHHIRRMHTENRKVYQCEVCNKSYRDKHLLTIHQRVHTNERPYMCQICNKRYRHSYGCRKHLKKVHKLDLKYRLNDPLEGNSIPITRFPTSNEMPQNEIHTITADDKHEMVVEIPVAQNLQSVASTVEVHSTDFGSQRVYSYSTISTEVV